MHARPHYRKDELTLRSLRDLGSRWVFAPVRPRLARWEHRRPQGAAGTRGNGAGIAIDMQNAIIEIA